MSSHAESLVGESYVIPDEIPLPVDGDRLSLVVEEMGVQASVNSLSITEVPVGDDEAELDIKPHYSADMRLIILCRNGHPSHFEDLVKKYERTLKYISRSYYLQGGSEADLYQEALIGFYHAVRDYDGTSSFDAFAKLCTTRQVITAVKTATRFKHVPLNHAVSFDLPLRGEEDGGRTLGDSFSDNSLMPDLLLESKEGAQKFVDFILYELSELERTAWQLFASAWSYADIATELYTDTKTVDNALQRVKRKLEVYKMDD
jgi:RNA polymerase sporulation-specific sigma factor